MKRKSARGCTLTFGRNSVDYFEVSGVLSRAIARQRSAFLLERVQVERNDSKGRAVTAERLED